MKEIGRKLAIHAKELCTVCSLRETMYAHLESYDLDNDLPPGFQENFPETITLKQSVATWRLIIFYQLRHEQEINEQ